MTDIEVQAVNSRKDVINFIKFPWQIYKNTPNWVPPLISDRKKVMDRQKNPFYKHAEVEYFLARKNGRILGRIAAILNHAHNTVHHENIGFFGFFECVNDQLVANALFEKVRDLLKTRGVSAIRGPASPSINDEYGLLVDGFDQLPAILMPYNPPYYQSLIESAGFHKIKDLYSYHLKKADVISEKLVRVAEIVRKREGLTFRSLKMDDFENEVKLIKELYNRVWQNNWGAVPMTDEEFDALAKDLKPIVVPDLVIIAEYNHEPIGFALTLPDLNIALKHNRSGNLLTGLFYLMWHRKKINRVRIIILGVLPERQKTGAASVLFYETARRGIELGYTEGEAGWVLEDNFMMNRAAELFNSTRYKTYRIYDMSIT